MKPLSPRAMELIDTLRQAPSFRERIRGSEDRRLGVLAELKDLLEPGIVPHLLGLVAAGPPPVARAAAEVISRTVASRSPAALVEMDGVWRGSGWYSSTWSSEWWALKPPAVAAFVRLGNSATAILGIASFHPDGYVREAAVTRLEQQEDGRELPFLLIRLNDWVAAIADRAREAVERRIRPGYGAAFIDHLPILLRLQASTRRDHDRLLERVYSLLKSPEERDALDRGLGSASMAARRVAFRLARDSAHVDQAQLFARALRDSDTVIRLESIADARREPADPAIAALLPVAIHDSYPHVRREALAAATELLPEQADALLRSALLDGNVVVREAARFFLQRRGAMSDFISFYRARVSSAATTRELAAAIAGIGETGESGDVAVIAPSLAHERAAVRRAAVRAIGALDLTGHIGDIARMLRDDSPGVSHASRDLLRRRASSVGAPFLLDVLRAAPHAHNRIDALLVASGLGKWASLPVLIEGAGAADDELRKLARALVLAWIAGQNRRFEQPTSAEVEAIGAALHSHHLALGRSIAGELAATLRPWTR